MSIYVYIFVMALVTYMIRMLPMTLIRHEIKNSFFRSFLYYVPFVTLSVMTFPAILSCTANIYSALSGFITALVMAYYKRSLISVALSACAATFIVELFIK